MNLENILREKSESQKTICFHLYEISGTCKSTKTESRFVVAKHLAEKMWVVTAKENRVYCWGDENILDIASGDGCIIYC